MNKKLILTTTVLILVSLPVSSQEILILCKGDEITDSKGFREFNYDTTYKLDLRKKYWIPARFTGKINSTHKLVVSDNFFYSYHLDDYYQFMKRDTASIIFREISRIDGRYTGFIIYIPGEKFEKFKKEIRSLNEIAKAKKIRELVNDEVFSYFGKKFPDKWVLSTANCSKTQKKF
tara:strand:- start:481 stop:1008 length:528 start_codon:yes stop_codon:yes gene_type:complete